MKKSSKIISIVLSIIMICSFVSVLASAAEACTCTRAPIIYVWGKQPIYNEKGKDVLDETVIDVAKASLLMSASLAEGLIENKWDDFTEAVYQEMIPFYREYALDKNGEIWNNTKPAFDYKVEMEGMTDFHSSKNVQECEFKYDCRIDPYIVAAQLNEYVECVKEKTGHDKVCLVARCLGTNIITTYLSEYASKDNFAGIESVVLYASTVKGVDLLDQIFTGKIKVEPSAVGSFSTDIIDIDNTSLLRLISATLNLVYATGYVNKGTDMSNKILAKLYETTIPRIIRDTFATMPGYWSMISAERYEEAKKYVFGDNISEYSTLIAKLDNYRKIQNNAETLYTDMVSKGVKIGVIAKYGLQLKPVVQNCDIMSDNTISTAKQSFGATCSTINGQLSDEYIESLGEKAKYVSLDKKVDASTCLFPDNTWFIKDVPHSQFPKSVNDIIDQICHEVAQKTVFDTAWVDVFPQFLKWDGANGTRPLTAENTETGHDDVIAVDGQVGKEQTIFKATLAWCYRAIQSLFDWIDSFFE